MASVAELLLQQGRSQGDAIRQRGDIRARTYANLGGIAQQAIGDYQQNREQENAERVKAEREAARVAVFQNGMPDYNTLLTVYSPAEAGQIMTGLKAVDDLERGKVADAKQQAGHIAMGLMVLPQAVQQSAWPQVKALAVKAGIAPADQLPDQVTPEFLQSVVTMATGKAPEKPKVGTIAVKVRNADGSETTKLVPDTPGQEFTSAPEPPKPGPPVFRTVKGPNGRPIYRQLTPDEVTAGVEEYRAPNEGPQPSFTRAEIVMPDGTIKTANYNSRTGKYSDPDTGGLLQGVGRAPTDKDIASSEGKKKLGGIVTALSSLSEKINTANGVIATLKGKEEKAKASINLNDDVAEYQSIIESFTPIIARALGHTGVLTQMDVDSAKAMFPKPEDSKSLRDRKVKRLNELLQLEAGKSGGGADPLGIRK